MHEDNVYSYCFPISLFVGRSVLAPPPSFPHRDTGSKRVKRFWCLVPNGKKIERKSYCPKSVFEKDINFKWQPFSNKSIMSLWKNKNKQKSTSFLYLSCTSVHASWFSSDGSKTKSSKEKSNLRRKENIWKLN